MVYGVVTTQMPDGTTSVVEDAGPAEQEQRMDAFFAEHAGEHPAGRIPGVEYDQDGWPIVEPDEDDDPDELM